MSWGALSSGTTWLHWPLSLPCASQAVSLGVHPRGLPSNPKSNPTRREPCGRGGEAPRTCLCSLRPKPAAASEPWPAGCAGLRVTHIPAPRERNSPQHGRIHFLSCSQRPWQSSGRVGSALLPIHVERGPKTLCPNQAWPLLGCKGGGSGRQHWAWAAPAHRQRNILAFFFGCVFCKALPLPPVANRGCRHP